MERRVIVELTRGEWGFSRCYVPPKWVTTHIRKMRQDGWKIFNLCWEYEETGTDDD